MFRRSQGSQFSLGVKADYDFIKNLSQPSCLFVATETTVLSLFLAQMQAAVHLPPAVQWKHLAA